MSEMIYRNILAIDSSSQLLQLGLGFGSDRLVKKQLEVGQSHGQVIMRKIQDLLDSASCTVDQLHGIVVNTGPGSFTGLRIGLAAAKAMAVALQIPIVSTHLFDIASNKLRSYGKSALVIIPFKKDEAFLFDTKNIAFNESMVDIRKLDSITDIITNSPFAVYGWDLPDELQHHPNNITSLVQYDAADLLRIGKEKFDQNILADIETVEPLYIQKSQAELNFERRNKK